MKQLELFPDLFRPHRAALAPGDYDADSEAHRLQALVPLSVEREQAATQHAETLAAGRCWCGDKLEPFQASNGVWYAGVCGHRWEGKDK